MKRKAPSESPRARVRIVREWDGQEIEKVVWRELDTLENLRRMEKLLPGRLVSFEVMFTVDAS
jgi:hypothetical protein